MGYMLDTVNKFESCLTENEKKKIETNSKKRIVFDDNIGCYTIVITDYIIKLFGNEIIKEARIICDSGDNDINNDRNFIEYQSYILSLCSEFNLSLEQKSFEDEDAYIEITFINDRKIGFWANGSKFVMEESEYDK